MHSDNSALNKGIDQLYQDHHAWLSNWLNRRVGCRDHAADLAQDVFMRLLKNRESTVLSQPRAYLSSIARGLMIDQYRRKALEQAYLESIAHLEHNLVPSQEERLLLLEALERLDQLLDRLPARARQAFLYAQLDGLTCPQIAEKLGVSRATVERDLAKALHACYRQRYADA